MYRPLSSFYNQDIFYHMGDIAIQVLVKSSYTLMSQKSNAL